MANNTNFDISILKNNKQLVLNALEEQLDTGLTLCGMIAEGYAVRHITQNGSVDTGTLKNSITHAVTNNHPVHSMDIGTNVEYGIYVELGTGIYATTGGRRSPWVWEGKGKYAGFHVTQGQKPKPFLKPALADHVEAYKKALEKALKA